MHSRKPKVLHELCGLPMVLWPVRAALAAGAGQVVVVDSPERALEDVLPAQAQLAVQARPDGTGGAVAAGIAHLDADRAHGDALVPRTDAAGADGDALVARADAGGGQMDASVAHTRAGDAGTDAPVVVLSGDVPLVGSAAIERLVRAHVDAGVQATMASTVLDDPSGYGRVVRDGDGGFERVVETKAGGDASARELEIREVNTGIYVFSGHALRAALPRLTAENAQGELYLPQVLELIRADGGSAQAHLIADPQLVLGVNDRAGLARVRQNAQAAIHARHMAAGVTIVNPGTTVIDVDVQIGPDSTIEPFTTIKGATTIGVGCVVKHSYLVDCLLEDGASAGPFAYLRPGSLLRAGAKVGTFVEVKNSDIGAAAKVPHLSYIGDADVGEEANLGASTITANYDGHAKHRTTIGKRVRSSVHVSFVAPVTVGDSAYTAAGSVINEDVPAGALGIARARQINKEGYAARREAHAREGHEREVESSGAGS